jgi:hypothetical protein
MKCQSDAIKQVAATAPFFFGPAFLAADFGLDKVIKVLARAQGPTVWGDCHFIV